MKQNILFALFFSLTATVYGQQNPDIFVYNHSSDTICFSKIGKVQYEIIDCPVKYDPRIDTFLNDYSITTPLPSRSDKYLILDSLQIDGKGSKEIIVCRKISESISVHGGTYDGINSYYLEKIEIWNLDTKELCWGEVILYSSISVGPNNNFSLVVFNYDYKIDSVGEIVVINKISQINFDGSLSLEIIPELKAGVYQFTNGGYRHTK